MKQHKRKENVLFSVHMNTIYHSKTLELLIDITTI